MTTTTSGDDVTPDQLQAADEWLQPNGPIPKQSAPTNLSTDELKEKVRCIVEVLVGSSNRLSKRLVKQREEHYTNELLELFSTYQQRGVALAGSGVPPEANQDNGGR